MDSLSPFDQRMIFDGNRFCKLRSSRYFPRGISITKEKSAKLIFTYKAGKCIKNIYRTGKPCFLPDGYLVLGAEKDFDPANAEVYLNDSKKSILLKSSKEFSGYKSRN